MTGSATFRQRLQAVGAKNPSRLIVGLDVEPGTLPEGMPSTAEGVLAFNRVIIDATADLVAGYKLNFAFFHTLGRRGWEALEETRRLIPAELLSIADAKLGDIGSSSRLYAKAVFEDLDFDAVTLSPYVGREGLQPFLAQRGRGSFILCRTSNRDGSIQHLDSAGVPLYERIAAEVSSWGENAGLVVGATDTPALTRVRSLAPETPLLVPGVGAQGGDIGNTVEALKAGGPALIAVSRAVIMASRGRNFATAARAAAGELATAIADGPADPVAKADGDPNTGRLE